MGIEAIEIQTEWYLGIKCLETNEEGDGKKLFFKGWVCQEYEGGPYSLGIHGDALPFESKREGLKRLKRSRIKRDYKGATIIYLKTTITDEEGEIGTL